MAYSFRKSDKSVLAGLKRIGKAQTLLALNALGDTSLSLDEKVYAVRRRIKKLRTLIRLVRPVLPAYEEENATLREAGRRLSEARDAAVMIETFDEMTIRYSAHLSDALCAPIRERLIEQRRAISDAGLGISLLETETELRAFLVRLPSWKLEKKGAAAFEAGLKKTYAKAVKRLRQAAETDDAEDLHAWRKSAKHHWLQMRLIKKVWPEGLGPRIFALDQLTDDLGEHHDLSVLQALLESDADEAASAFLNGPVKTRLSELEESVIEAGRELFAEEPAQFARRCAAYWNVWREEGCLLRAG
ncbi:CHAD domain-containing protein [Parvularcula marina]|uniref:CHAD domain-containing protein n=1 Tax=Parvularcula marina TaxID=2292771 RepID=A0A371RH35_9PROT|nr:CHAD domain-containing protein [Parvularcula marina]RFB04750.1 CHAD domain-containing protein [Parvularcula marina]